MDANRPDNKPRAERLFVRTFYRSSPLVKGETVLSWSKYFGQTNSETHAFSGKLNLPVAAHPPSETAVFSVVVFRPRLLSSSSARFIYFRPPKDRTIFQTLAESLFGIF
jgi:hypothetical protein